MNRPIDRCIVQWTTSRIGFSRIWKRIVVSKVERIVFLIQETYLVEDIGNLAAYCLEFFGLCPGIYNHSIKSEFMIDTLRKLYLLQVSSSGIPLSVCSTLTQEEKALLFEDGKKFFLRPEQRKKIHVVLTGGVFDVLHIGHILTLTEAKTHGDVLVVAIAKDDHIRQKGREPVHSQEYRRVMVEALKPVDIALVGMDNPQDLLKSVRPDVIVYGYDQKEFAKPEGVRIVKLDKKIDDSKFKTSKILNTLGL